MHHWCFHSLVGSTLASLELRSRLAILQSALDNRDAGGQQAIEDILRFDIAQKLLRPLAEGLALFAEHDVEPHPATNLISRPMAWIAAAFTTPEEDESQRKLFRPLLAVLRQMRVSEAHIRRKANLFLEPLSASSAGGYLSGYLTVKGLWRLACRRSDRFRDPDLFYTFLERYFYRDYGFVVCLLQERTVGPRAADEMVGYFQRRLDDLGRLDLDAEAERLDRMEDVLQTDPDEAISPAINTPPELVNEGKKLINKSNQLLQSSPRDSPQVKRLKGFHARTLARRSFMCVGRGAVSLEPAKPGFVAVKSQGQIVLEVQALPGWKPAHIEGALDLHISLSGLFSVIAISAAGSLIALAFSENADQAVKEYVVTASVADTTTSLPFDAKLAALFKDQIQEYLTDQTMADKLNDSLREMRETFIDTTGFRPVHEAAQSDSSRIVDDIYRTASLGWADSARLDACYAQMAGGGLYPIVNKDKKLVLALAALSLASSVGLSLEEAGKYLPSGVAEVEADLQKLAKCSEEKGFPMVYPIDGALDSFV